MKRRYRSLKDPRLIEDILQSIREMTREDWQRELAWRPPPEVYDPWPPYENGTGKEAQAGEGTASDAPDSRADTDSPAGGRRIKS